MARDEVGRVQRMIAAAQGNINRAAAQIRQRFAEMQLQPQRGVFVADAPQGALKGGGVCHAGRRGKTHLTGNLGLEIGEGEAGIVQGRIEAAAVLTEGGARVGRADAAGTAVQQLDAV